jgi:hypothetical protein
MTVNLNYMYMYQLLFLKTRHLHVYCKRHCHLVYLSRQWDDYFLGLGLVVNSHIHTHMYMYIVYNIKYITNNLNTTMEQSSIKVLCTHTHQLT